MNWEALSAIGEFVSALAVIVTLLYLARQIREGTRSTAMAALRDTTQQWNHWSDMLATSADLAQIVVCGNRSIDELTEADALRYGAYVQSFFDNAESYWSLVTRHDVDRDLHVLESIVGRRLAIPGFRAWWQRNTGDYAEDFVDWIAAVASRQETPAAPARE